MQSVDLDIRGQICPSCLLLALKELNRRNQEIRAGDAEIVITTDDRQATSTIPIAAEHMGYAVDVHAVDGVYRIRIRGQR
ncbi:MAG: tRNA methyltransferase [Thiobacillus sp. 65-29]|nr:MAG: tRNA methyltransferase [Thiobacillus sp. 65-29]